jgi:hypothetical protein
MPIRTATRTDTARMIPPGLGSAGGATVPEQELAPLMGVERTEVSAVIRARTLDAS